MNGPSQPGDVRMRGFSHRTTVTDAITWLDGQVETLSSERVPLTEAAGRVLAGDVASPRNVPGFDRAMMDGFAVRAADTLDACAMAILEHGVEFVLITGTHENTPSVENTLYANHRVMETFTWDRLEGSFHGSGCTLAASIAGLLAQGLEPFTAIHEAQEYTWQALAEGYRIGMGQQIPNRLFWARGEEEQ